MLTLFQDAFFYSLVYDPTAKTLLADKGEIRIGDKYQASSVDLLSSDEIAKEVAEPSDKRETIVYHPYHTLTDRDIDQFLIVARYDYFVCFHRLSCLIQSCRYILPRTRHIVISETSISAYDSGSSIA